MEKNSLPQQQTLASPDNTDKTTAASVETAPSRKDRVRNIIREQFGDELTYKEEELERIEDRIRLAKMMLQRLRLGVLAQHYGVSGFYPTALDYREETVGAQGSWETFEKEFIKRQSAGADESDPSSPVESKAELSVVFSCIDEGEAEQRLSSECQEGSFIGAEAECEVAKVKSEPAEKDRIGSWPSLHAASSKPASLITASQPPLRTPSPLTLTKHVPPEKQPQQPEATVSRFYIKKRIIVGNTSQYLDPTANHACTGDDGSTHKWMVYVRGSHAEPDISHFVKAVRFFLHPSYHPNDIIRIKAPPFHLTRLGWGEFPIRIQLEFCDKSNKPADIIHNLVLDRTHTGQQTLGAETVVDLDLVAGSIPNSFSARNGLCLNKALPLPLSDTRGVLYGPSGTTREEVVAMDTSLPSGSSLSISGAKLDLLNPQATVTPLCPSSINIHYGSLSMASRDSKESVHLDHDYCTTMANSATPSSSRGRDRVSSAEGSLIDQQLSTGVNNNQLVLTTNIDKNLHTSARGIPLFGRTTLSDDFHISAISLVQFRSWNIGRRRAAEWMRAVAMKHHLEKSLQISSVLTTKQVMQWCRRNGYTPLDPVSANGPGFCKYCGCQLEPHPELEDNDEAPLTSGASVHDYCKELFQGDFGEDSRDPMTGRDEMDTSVSEDELTVTMETTSGVVDGRVTSIQQRLSTLSEPHNLLAGLVREQVGLEKLEKETIEDQVLNVKTVPSCSSCARSRAMEPPIPRFRVPQTPELKWVQQTAACIGIYIFPAVIDRMYAHVVEHMMYMSCAKFLRGILSQAVQEAGSGVEGELHQDRVITPLHVQRAARNLEQCDFLTNKYLGLDVDGGVSSPQSPDGSESESDSSSSSGEE